MDDIFLQCSRCNEHGSNMSNKRLRNGSLLLLSKKKGEVLSAIAKRRKTVFCDKSEATFALLLEQVSKILQLFDHKRSCVFYDSHLYLTHSVWNSYKRYSLFGILKSRENPM